jgi:hypothetical protein
MGVRFECPQGHKLHVKAHLSGQRGICPECGVRFVVPAFSGGRVAEAAGADASPSGDDFSASIESTAVFNAGLAQSSQAAGGDETQWYVRFKTGEQYGPAGTDDFRQWVADGRVPVNSWVWRTGWADWKVGSEAVQTFALEKSRTPPPPPTQTPSAPAPRTPTPRPAAASKKPAAVEMPVAKPVPLFDLGDDWPPSIANGHVAAAAATDSIYVARRRSRKANQMATLILGVIALVLAVVVVIVMKRPTDAPKEGDAPTETPAATSTL